MTNPAHALNHEIIDDLRAILGSGFDEIVKEQVEQAGIYLGELQQLLDDDDAYMAMRRAHALKSSAGQIGLHGIYRLARDLEVACDADAEKGQASPQAKALFRQLRDGFAGAVQKLLDYTRGAGQTGT